MHLKSLYENMIFDWIAVMMMVLFTENHLFLICFSKIRRIFALQNGSR